MPQNPMVSLSSILPSKVPALSALGKQADQLMSGLHGSKYTQSYNGNLFLGANPSGVTTSAGLATTCVGLILSNAAGSTKNLVLRRVTGAFIVLPATNPVGLGLITGYAAGGITVHTTPLVPFSGLIGTGPAPVAKLDSAATLVGTPIWTIFFAETPTVTTAPFFSIDLEGAIVLPPGAYAVLGTTIAGPASGFQGSFEWEEVPV